MHYNAIHFISCCYFPAYIHSWMYKYMFKKRAALLVCRMKFLDSKGSGCCNIIFHKLIADSFFLATFHVQSKRYKSSIYPFRANIPQHIGVTVNIIAKGNSLHSCTTESSNVICNYIFTILTYTPTIVIYLYNRKARGTCVKRESRNAKTWRDCQFSNYL